MECMLQWLDDLDDLVSLVAHLAERLWFGAAPLLAMLAAVGAFAGLAFFNPPVATAVVCVLTAALLWRSSATARRSTFTA